MLEESSLWLCIDQHSALIGADANNREVMDSDWTALAQPGRISLHAYYHTQTLYQCLWTMWVWLRHSVDVTVTKEAHSKPWFNDSLWRRLQAHKCFLHLRQHVALKTTNWCVNVSFHLHLFGLFLSCWWNGLEANHPLISLFKFAVRFDNTAMS